MNPAEPLAWFEPEDGTWFEHRRRRIVTRGASRTVIVPAGPALFERIADAARAVLDEVGGLVVIAAPFHERSQALVTVPASLLHERDPTPLPAPSATVPRPLRREAFPTREDYEAMVGEALRRIDEGEIDKVVLARMLIVHAATPFDRRRLIATLAHSEPESTVFAANGFIGASPELLVALEGDAVRAHPLAGTTRRAEDPSGAGLLASAKDRREHALVVDAVSTALRPLVRDLRVPETPSLVGTSSLWHLGTSITATRRSSEMTALDLVAAIHPTPAVCGTPREAARNAIGDIERFDRMAYAGAVGWMDADGDGEWMVTLRCAEVRGRLAMLFAGAGIVRGSVPERELAETEAKFLPMLQALETCQLA